MIFIWIYIWIKKNLNLALTGVSSFCKAEGHGVIPSWGKRLGCRFGAQLGHVREATERYFFLALMFLSLPLSVNEIKSLKKLTLVSFPEMVYSLGFAWPLSSIPLFCHQGILSWWVRITGDVCTPYPDLIVMDRVSFRFNFLGDRESSLPSFP